MHDQVHGVLHVHFDKRFPVTFIDLAKPNVSSTFMNLRPDSVAETSSMTGVIPTGDVKATGVVFANPTYAGSYSKKVGRSISKTMADLIGACPATMGIVLLPTTRTASVLQNWTWNSS